MKLPFLLFSLLLPLSAYGGYVEHQGYLYGVGTVHNTEHVSQRIKIWIILKECGILKVQVTEPIAGQAGIHGKLMVLAVGKGG